MTISKGDQLPDITPIREQHEVTILWAERPEAEDRATTYSFDSLAELNAFMLGVTEAEGWLGLHVVHDSREDAPMTADEIEAATVDYLVNERGYDRDEVIAIRTEGYADE